MPTNYVTRQSDYNSQRRHNCDDITIIVRPSTLVDITVKLFWLSFVTSSVTSVFVNQTLSEVLLGLMVR